MRLSYTCVYQTPKIPSISEGRVANYASDSRTARSMYTLHRSSPPLCAPSSLLRPSLFLCPLTLSALLPPPILARYQPPLPPPLKALVETPPASSEPKALLFPSKNVIVHVTGVAEVPAG